MTESVTLPRQIVDHLRAMRGGIVDYAVETGRIVIVEQKQRGEPPHERDTTDTG